MGPSTRSLAVLALEGCLCALASLRAQAAKGTITGAITDERGYALPGVIVAAIEHHGGPTLAARTGPDGSFAIEEVPDGVYDLTSLLTGFAPRVSRDVAVVANAGSTVTLVTFGLTLDQGRQDVWLEPGLPRTPELSPWSAVVNGVSAQLLSRPYVRDGQMQARLEMALDNRTDDSLWVWWSGSMSQNLRLEGVTDEGELLEEDHPGGSEQVLPPTWLELPAHTVTLRAATNQVFEYIADGRRFLRPFTFQAWELRPAFGTRASSEAALRPQTAARLTFCLRGRLSTLPPPARDGKTWSGSLDIPAVRLPAPSTTAR